MGEFFSGWRRKVGMATLLMALLFMGLWIRGHGVMDLYQFGGGHGTTFRTFVFSQHGMMWMKSDSLDDWTMGWSPGWKTAPPSATLHNEEPKVKLTKDIKWRWSCCGFDFCQMSNDTDYRYSQQNIPYWSITIPLTLISAFLLLSKPKASAQMETVELISAEGT